MKKVETIECPIEGALNYMQEEIVGLAEDIINHSDALGLHAERLYYLEENCFGVDGEGGMRAKLEEVDEAQNEVIDNLTQLVEVVSMAAEVAKNQNSVLEIHEHRLRDLSNEIDETDEARAKRVIGLAIWNLILSVGLLAAFWL